MTKSTKQTVPRAPMAVSSKTISTLDIVDEKFSEILGIPKDKVRFGAEPRYKSIASAKFLSSNRGLEQSEQHDIVAEAYELIESDLSSRKLTPSKKLWVPRVRFDWSTDHETAEVPLERSVAGLFRLYRLLLTENPQADPVWFNQIPVSSGIIQHGKGSRAIDLVCRRSRGQYDFVELKFPKGTPTETPLFAALEVLKYGLIYLYVLCHPGVLKVPGWPDKSDMPKNARGEELLEATDVTLCVLAPKRFYSRFDFGWLDEQLNNDFARFLSERKPGRLRTLSFRFDQLENEPFEITHGNGFRFDFSRKPIPRDGWSSLVQ